MNLPETERCPRCFRDLEAGACVSCGWSDPFAADAATVAPPAATPTLTAGVVTAQEEDLTTFPPPAQEFDTGPPGGLPDAPSGGFQTPDPEAGPSDSDAGRVTRVLTWLLLFGLVGLYALQGGGLEVGVSESTLRSAGCLDSGIFDSFELEWWRLVLATFLHGQFIMILISGFMVWALAGAAERQGGAGLVLVVLVGVGAVSNALRVSFEAPGSLLPLAGAWPGLLACGGAALTLAPRIPRVPSRGVLSSILFEVGLILLVAYQDDRFSWGLALVVACSLALGAFVGFVWPVDASRRSTSGFVGALTLLLVSFAFMGRDYGLQRTTPPPLELREADPGLWEEWKAQHPGVRTDEPDPRLRDAPLDELGVSIQVPAGWDPAPLQRKRKCEACQEEVELPEPQPEDPKATIPCPKCGEPVKARKRLHQAMFLSSTFRFGQRLWLSVIPRHPFDAPDTLVLRVLGQFQDPSSGFSGLELDDEQPFASEHMGRGYAVDARARIQGSERTLRMYSFVGKKHSVVLLFMETDSGNPADVERSTKLFDAIAGTLKPLPAKKKSKKKKAQEEGDIKKKW